jgi:hypothetical protein
LSSIIKIFTVGFDICVLHTTGTSMIKKIPFRRSHTFPHSESSGLDNTLQKSFNSKNPDELGTIGSNIESTTMSRTRALLCRARSLSSFIVPRSNTSVTQATNRVQNVELRVSSGSSEKRVSSGSSEKRVSSGSSEKRVSSGSSDSEREFFTEFQESILEYANTSPGVSYKELSKHSHHGCDCSSTNDVFMYRGVSVDPSKNMTNNSGNILDFSDTAYVSAEKDKMRDIAIETLHIPYRHIQQIDILLDTGQDPKISRKSILKKIERVEKIKSSIDSKISLKKMLSVAIKCIDCEIKHISLLKYELLHQITNEEELISRDTLLLHKLYTADGIG